jgi:hypothetical protein
MSPSPSTPPTPYTHEVLRLYVRLPDTPDRPRPSDRRLAAELELQRLPIALIRGAFALATARRATAPGALTPIRSLHYFLPVIAELQTPPAEPFYLEYLERRSRADSLSGGRR